MSDTSDKKRPWYKRWWGVLVIVILAFFVFGLIYTVKLTFQYYGQIKRGEISTADLAFLGEFTTTDELRQRFLNTPEVEAPVLTTDDPFFGTPDAPLIIVEFGDFGCPYSRESSLIIRELATNYADKIFYQYRDFALDELHPNTHLASEASECAQELGNFWAFHDKLYQNQNQLTRENFIQYAREVGLDEAAFTTCLDSGKYAPEVQQDLEDGLAAGVRGTPTFFLNGRRIEGSIPRDIFQAIVEAATL